MGLPLTRGRGVRKGLHTLNIGFRAKIITNVQKSTNPWFCKYVIISGNSNLFNNVFASSTFAVNLVKISLDVSFHYKNFISHYLEKLNCQIF